MKYLSKRKEVNPNPLNKKLEDSALLSSIDSGNIECIKYLEKLYNNINWTLLGEYDQDIWEEALNIKEKNKIFWDNFYKYVIENNKISKEELDSKVSMHSDEYDLITQTMAMQGDVQGDVQGDNVNITRENSAVVDVDDSSL